MAGTDYDVIVGGYKLKVARQENGGYRRSFVRREIQQQLLSQADTPAIQSRSDRAALYQTSWAGGATWWKPLLTPNQVNTYFRSNHMDAWSEPGSVLPINKVTEGNDSTGEDVYTNAPVFKDASDNLYTIGNTKDVDATYQDVLKWNGSAWVQEVGYSSAGDGGFEGIVFDPNDEYFYFLDVDTAAVHRFSPANTAEDHDWIANLGEVAEFGATMLLTPQQGLMIYSGNKLYTVDKSGPSATQVFDDGLGYDWFKDLSSGASHPIAKRYVKLAISTPEGIYYAKNVSTPLGIQAYIFRVDKNTAGSWVGQPITTLPLGTIVLDMGYHLGSLVVSTTASDQDLFYGNTGNQLEVVFYSVDNSGLSVLGSPLGGRDEVDETPYKLLQSRGPLLYIAGQKRLWVYDGARGGLHTVLEWPTVAAHGGINSMAVASDSTDQIMFFMGHTASTSAVWFYYKTDQVDDPDTVAAFGDDETHYTLESNYFDFGLPMETKELTKVEIIREKDDGGSEWTVQVSADDGAFADILVDSGSNAYASADLSGTTGRRFRYRLIYQTKDTARKSLEALKITATSGEQVQEWELLIDGDEILNVDNQVQDEQTFYDNMITLAQTNTTTTIIDNMQEQEQEQDSSGTGIRVKVMQARILKEKPGESLVQLVVRED